MASFLRLLLRPRGLNHRQMRHNSSVITTGWDTSAEEDNLTDQERHAKTVNPEAFAFLTSTKVSSRRPDTLWDRLATYAGGYNEKSVLLDPAVASSVAEAVMSTTEAHPEDTLFIDADGGCCQVAKTVLERGAFSKAKVFRRDKQMGNKRAIAR